MKESERTELLQKIIDRLVAPSGDLFANQLKELIDFYPDNERPLNEFVPRLILMNGTILK